MLHSCNGASTCDLVKEMRAYQTLHPAPCAGRRRHRLEVSHRGAFLLRGFDGAAAVGTAMVSLKLQKRLAASVLSCGLRKVWLDPNEANDISMANSRATLLPALHPS